VKQPIAVIKVGGDILQSDAQKQGLAHNVSDLYELGWKVILLHGGGPQVNELQIKLGITPHKIAGRRITSKVDLETVKQAIAGQVNVDLVSLLCATGLPAFGFHGASASMINATKRPPMVVKTHSDEPIDFGEVGDVQSINEQLLIGLFELNVIPVIATLGIDNEGNVFNINADTTVIAIAECLKADLLLLITEVGGIYTDIARPDSLIKSANSKKVMELINSGVITDGMIAKVEEAMKALQNGVATVVIASAEKPGLFKGLANAKDELTDIKATQLVL